MRVDGDPSVEGAGLVSLIHQPQGFRYVDQAIIEKGQDLRPLRKILRTGLERLANLSICWIMASVEATADW